MSTAFLSPIELRSVKSLDVRFKVSPSGPEGDAKFGCDIRHEIVEFGRTDDSCYYFAVVNLTVGVTLRDVDSDEKLSGGIVLQGMLVCPCAGIDEDEARRGLEANAVSMLYSHARSCYMVLGSLSPCGEIILPPIVVEDYLRARLESTVEHDAVG